MTSFKFIVVDTEVVATGSHTCYSRARLVGWPFCDTLQKQSWQSLVSGLAPAGQSCLTYVTFELILQNSIIRWWRCRWPRCRIIRHVLHLVHELLHELHLRKLLILQHVKSVTRRYSLWRASSICSRVRFPPGRKFPAA